MCTDNSITNGAKRHGSHEDDEQLHRAPWLSNGWFPIILVKHGAGRRHNVITKSLNETSFMSVIDGITHTVFRPVVADNFWEGPLLARKSKESRFVYEFETLKGSKVVRFFGTVMTNEDEKFFWLRVGAAQGDSGDCLELAYRLSFERYLNPGQFDPDWEEAWAWFVRAGKLGEWRAPYHQCLIILFELAQPPLAGSAQRMADLAVKLGGAVAEQRVREAFKAANQPYKPARVSHGLSGLAGLKAPLEFCADVADVAAKALSSRGL